MKVKHIDHLNLSVRSFAETAAWYERVFGFAVVEDGIYDGRPWGVLRSGDAMLCAYEDPSRRCPDGEDLKARGLHGVNHFALRIVDPDKWEEIVRRENIEVFYGGAYRWPHSTAWYIKDPTGYTIEVAHWDDDTPIFGSRNAMALIATCAEQKDARSVVGFAGIRMRWL